MTRNIVLQSAAAALVLGLLVAPLQAGMLVTIDEVGSTVTYDVVATDGGLNGDNIPPGDNTPTSTSRGNVTDDDLQPYPGAPPNGTIGIYPTGLTFGVTNVTASSKPLLGSPSVKEINQVGVTLIGKGTVIVEFTDTDFLFQNTGRLYQLRSILFGSTTGQVTAQSYLDFSNAEFGTGFTPGIHGPFADPSFPAPPPTTGVVGIGETLKTRIVAPTSQDDFSLTQIITIVHDDDGDTTLLTFRTLVLVPEPASIAVWSLIVGLGVMVSRRRRRVR